LPYTDAELETILSPRHFVNVRKTYGGPAAEETQRAADASAAQLTADEAWWKGRMTALTDAEQRLATRAQAL
jgi:hypothetical protein